MKYWPEPQVADSYVRDGHGPSDLLLRLQQFAQKPGWAILPEDIASVRDDIDTLVSQGDPAVSAIRDFLRNARGSTLADDAIAKAGYGSLRLALFDVLQKIGGARAEAVLYDELEVSESPREIETLARYLDASSPGLYQRNIVTVARDTLALASDDGINGQDTGPLFRVLKDFGGAELANDLGQVSQLHWGQYAAVALASLPDGVGIPNLARWVEGASPGNVSAAFALNILAQSAQYPDARKALLESSRVGLIPDSRWPELARLLAGTYRIQLEPPAHGFTGLAPDAARGRVLRTRTYSARTPGGGQTLYGLESASPVLSPDSADARLDLIETLIDETDSPAARRELERAVNTLWSFYREQEGKQY
ncbi:hypothetical protein [Marinobacterium nitratireducens]|uniref:hypothetical protein n=1 Tax=Marinobacterium nitratireducens TaxID=518897 RepID=UPI00166B6751|nr:hypothetical protein [Marinobacterium nitratireducens]